MNEPVWILSALFGFAILVQLLAYLYRTQQSLRSLQQELNAATAGDGVDVILWGHFHSHWEFSEGGRLAMLVPGWLETRLAVVVEDDCFLAFFDQPLVQDVEQLEERRLVADLGDLVGLEASLSVRAVLAPDLEGEVGEGLHL